MAERPASCTRSGVVNAWPLWLWCCPRWRRGRWATWSGWSNGARPGGVRCRACRSNAERGGHVRECHGDLHLANIAWNDGQPRFFDALEFNPDLRWIDCMAEPGLFGDGPASAWAA